MPSTMKPTINIWKGMLKSGIDPGHVLQQVNAHIEDFKKLPSSITIDLALDEVREFRYDLKLKIRKGTSK